MRYILALAASVAVVSATNTKPCGNLCADGSAPAYTLTTDNGKTYAVCDNTDFVGSDIENGSIEGLTTPEDLADACSTTDGCIAGTVNADRGFGYLKNAVPDPYGSSSVGQQSIFEIMCDSSSTTTTTTAAATTTITTTTPAITTTTSAATTTPATTTTSAAATTTPVKPACPAPTDVYQDGNNYYYKFWSGSCARNSFKYSDYRTYPKSLSEKDAIAKCAAWASSVGSKGFQIFQYRSDKMWHCDTTATLNTDSNFKGSNQVDRMLQYNPVPDYCPINSQPTCPPAKTIVTGSCSSKSSASFSLFYSGYGKRNSFQYKDTITFDGRTRAEDAIQWCANFVSRLGYPVPAFQVFYYNKDCKWHCDSTAVPNTDSNFVHSSEVKQIFQFNAVAKECAPKSYPRDAFHSRVQKRHGC